MILFKFIYFYFFFQIKYNFIINMGWTNYQIFLVVLLVVTGSFNTLSTKINSFFYYRCRWNCQYFVHPFFQTVIMFLGEISCLLAFRLVYLYFRLKDNTHETRELLKGNKNFSVWIFCLPAMCDIIATSVMNIGLTLTYASSYQMLRGSLIVFVALLSVGFLQRKIQCREWIGIVIVISGLIIVGISDFMFNKDINVDTNSVITVTSVQIVLEEHFVSGKDIPPLQAVGWEGCFGFTILGFLLIPLYYIHIGKPISNGPEGRLEDLNDTFVQIKNNLMLLFPILGNAVSIAFFNFAGISVTKEISGTTRTVLDSVRTFFIWGITLALGWQSFSALQVN
ncbi:conserved hypothetical protein [Pediculus humanus corporis]|uniref:EamA domain-containing protein n=1 Tax=Pediculus humanus subsp. corporis TaxID=121224 RepID=E0W1D5_PEDHC|nr:uncharacterized protein Phum_PHUM575030 [Pediculus humanus corporis]EEB19441.1 conserved hypothetical protein [Pediculus humanus corporis]